MDKKQAKGTSARKSKAATSSTAQSKVNTSALTTPTTVTSASSNQSKTEVSSVPAPANKVHTILYQYVYQLSKAAPHCAKCRSHVAGFSAIAVEHPSPQPC